MENTHSAHFVRASTQFLSASDSTSLSFTGDHTIECWVYLTTVPTAGAEYGLVSKYTTTSNQRSWYYTYRESGGHTEFSIANSSDGTGANTATGTFTFTISQTTWTHVAFVYTASGGSVEVFVNGSSQGTISGMKTSVFDSTAILRLANQDNNNNTLLNGNLDEVRLWNVARTSVQISSNYQTELTGSETNLQAYYKLNNNLNDSTSNGNTLSDNNSVTFETNVPFSGATTTASNIMMMGV